MKTRIELNESDIKDIIAKHFEVEINSVTVTTKTESQGYGMAEHDVEVPIVYIEK